MFVNVFRTNGFLFSSPLLLLFPLKRIRKISWLSSLPLTINYNNWTFIVSIWLLYNFDIYDERRCTTSQVKFSFALGSIECSRDATVYCLFIHDRSQAVVLEVKLFVQFDAFNRQRELHADRWKRMKENDFSGCISFRSLCPTSGWKWSLFWISFHGFSVPYCTTLNMTTSISFPININCLNCAIHHC